MKYFIGATLGWCKSNCLQSSQKKMADGSNFEKSNLESMGIFNFKHE